MIQILRTMLQQIRCRHDYVYSHSRPGTLVCRKCRSRRGRP